MSLKVDADSLRQEILAATEFREKFLDRLDDLIRRSYGRFYRVDRKPGSPVTENHGYEYQSVMLPTLVYDNPRCKIRAARPDMTDAFGMTTMGDMAQGLELFLNRWSEDSNVAQPLSDMAVDFMFAHMVALVTIGNQPGYQGVEMTPQQPYIIRIAPQHFILDPAAMTWNPMQSNGPRYMGHMWIADKDDLVDDPDYNSDVIEKLSVDADVEVYLAERKHLSIPTRNEIVAWDIWVPEMNELSDAPEYNGTIYTVAVANTPAGTSKKAYMIRDPRPAYAPPWGPYVMHGSMKVMNSPYPLSPLAATAEQWEELNAHTTAAAENAAGFKKFAYGEKSNTADMETIKHASNGDVILLDDTDKIGQMEIGGTSEAEYKFVSFSRERLNRVSGLSDAYRGETSGVTATEASIADTGVKARIGGIKRQFRMAVATIFKTAAWYGFYGEDFSASLGEEGKRLGVSEFQGGIEGGREHFNFFDLSLSIDPLSMEHTDQAMFQRRVQLAFETVSSLSQVMSQTPWIKWREPVRTLFQSLNVGDADDWIDFQKLAEAQSNALMQQANPGAAQQQMESQAARVASASSPRLPGDRANIPSSMTGRAHIALARESGGMNAEAFGS
jgi:hypothetical protein